MDWNSITHGAYCTFKCKNIPLTGRFHIDCNNIYLYNNFKGVYAIDNNEFRFVTYIGNIKAPLDLCLKLSFITELIIISRESRKDRLNKII
jgi:hypothetical protein